MPNNTAIYVREFEKKLFEAEDLNESVDYLRTLRLTEAINTLTLSRVESSVTLNERTLLEVVIDSYIPDMQESRSKHKLISQEDYLQQITEIYTHIDTTVKMLQKDLRSLRKTPKHIKPEQVNIIKAEYHQTFAAIKSRYTDFTSRDSHGNDLYLETKIDNTKNKVDKALKLCLERTKDLTSNTNTYEALGTA